MAVIFDSINDNLTVAALTLPATGSLSFNVYPNWSQSDSVEHSFFDVRNIGSTNAVVGEKGSGNALSFGWVTSSTAYTINVADGTYTLNQSAWNKLGFTWDDTTNDSRLYLNGAEIGSNSTLVTWDTSSETWHLGTIRPDLLALNLDARLAEFGIWSRVLTPTEIAKLHRGLRPSCFLGGLANYWPLTTISDLTDHAGSKNLTNANVADAPDHPGLQPCAGGLIGGGVGSIL